jgi:hypothetical protein
VSGTTESTWRETILVFVTEGAEQTTGSTNEEEVVAMQDYEEKYADPELREEIKASGKGGKEGQQYVSNTEEATRARKNAKKSP